MIQLLLVKDIQQMGQKEGVGGIVHGTRHIFRRDSGRFPAGERKLDPQFMQGIGPVSGLAAFGTVAGCQVRSRQSDADGTGAFVPFLAARAGIFVKLQFAVCGKGRIVQL